MNQIKEKMSELAKKHTKEMCKLYSDQIDYSIKNTHIYSIDDGFEEPDTTRYKTKIIIDNIDSVDAIMKYHDGVTAVLNFASYKYPGGKFLEGSTAQEECLCHKSFLYNVLENFVNPYYIWNRKHLNHSLYLNRALYSRKILFTNGNKTLSTAVYSDVITCAAPNKGAAVKYHNIDLEENSTELDSRIKFIYDIAYDRGVDTLILGAFGCGVFKQNPEEVAIIFKKYNTMYNGCFKQIIFPFPIMNKFRENSIKNYQEMSKTLCLMKGVKDINNENIIRKDTTNE